MPGKRAKGKSSEKCPGDMLKRMQAKVVKKSTAVTFAKKGLERQEPVPEEVERLEF